MDFQANIEPFLAGDQFAVVGASTNREKYGNKVLRCYQQNGRAVHPINPGAKEVEGLPCYASLSDAPGPIHGVSIITPPKITLQVVEEAAKLGIKHLWMQPGAESPEAIARGLELGLSLVADGSCLLVVLGYKE